MPHYTPLIATIVAGFVISFIMGAIAMRLRVSPIAGYLLAGVLMGPFTPGFVGDVNLANELAEIGVILLMFGVGLHFSLKDLMAVRNIAVPGAIVQIAAATLMGMGLAMVLGWSLMGGFVFGLALSVASTVVLLRALQARDLVDTERGRIAVGWLIVEDIAMVLALVLLPVLAGMERTGGGLSSLVVPFAITLFKVGAFVAFMLVVARRAIPWMLHWVVSTGSRELFRLAVLAIALGVAAGAAFVFDVSFALGAFFAGMILGETELSRRAAEDTLPLRDAFAVLFFVSVGMLFDPRVVIEQPLPLLATVTIIVVGKSLAAYFIVRTFGHSNQKALTIAASLAQIGEFSFILASLGMALGVLPRDARDLILAGAIFSIFLNPFIFTLILRGDKKEESFGPPPRLTGVVPPEGVRPVLLVGFGRVGNLIGRDLVARGCHVVVIEDDGDTAKRAEDAGMGVVRGSALDDRTLFAAGIEQADALLIAIAHGYEGGAIAEKARALRPDLSIIARAHSDDEVRNLEQRGAQQVVMGERELARRMLELAIAGKVGAAL